MIKLLKVRYEQKEREEKGILVMRKQVKKRQNSEEKILNIKSF
ncbi:unnamed protein product [Paramecium sonneborni]|uniref:Uncharacterized protein n=1 Tax=Paramecium sonneborni TaxID=65129 RepID=A0A8S1MP40_9CILI|nr:unnamed protein product [Paramecium sonneborni]